ncbi:DUF1810 domain-containing protein [Flavobacterium sp.]|uniref:DUF1810 domain-containing protein n=1 Tax=Flavobacterium sp. TaxID=239 RepID=UPI003C468FE9
MADNTDVIRFLDAHNKLYLTAISELKNGKKETHWMWFIFPQLRGLGKSSISNFYGIVGLDEAEAFMNHRTLSNNLIEISKVLLQHNHKSIDEIFGFTDAQKLLSCMTLFSETSNSHPVFHQIIDSFFVGKKDEKTLQLLNSQPLLKT